MVPTVFTYWGVACGQDFGEMVFNLIRVNIFGRTESDSIEDFKGGYDFHDALVTPCCGEPALHPRLRVVPPRANRA